MQKKQKLQVAEIFTKENKKNDMGTFYLTEWSNKDYKTMQFKAQDILNILDATTFYGAIYEKEKFETVIANILETARLNSSFYEIEDQLKNIEISGYIPVCSHRQALQQAIFAVCAVADCSRSDKIKIYTLDKISSNKSIDNKASVFQNTRKTQQTETVSAVAITSHRYIRETNATEVLLCTYDFELDIQGTHILTWDDPAYDIYLIFQNSGTKVETGIGELVKERTCNSITIDLTEYSTYNSTNKLLMLALGFEIFYKEYKKYPVEFGWGLYYEGYNFDKAVIAIRDEQTTYAKDFYYIDLEQKTAVSETSKFSTTFTMNDINSLNINIYGCKYKHITTVYQTDTSADKTEENIKKVENAYLVNPSNAVKIAQHILDYYSKSFEDSFKMILNDEQVAECRKINTDFNNELIGNITQLDIDLTGGFLANAKMINKLKEENNNE